MGGARIGARNWEQSVSSRAYCRFPSELDKMGNDKKQINKNKKIHIYHKHFI